MCVMWQVIWLIGHLTDGISLRCMLLCHVCNESFQNVCHVTGHLTDEFSSVVMHFCHTLLATDLLSPKLQVTYTFKDSLLDMFTKNVFQFVHVSFPWTLGYQLFDSPAMHKDITLDGIHFASLVVAMSDKSLKSMSVVKSNFCYKKYP